MSDLRELREILTWLDAQPGVSRTLAAAARIKNLPSLDSPGVAIAILRDSTVEQVLPYIEVACFRRGLRATVWLSELTTAQRDVRDAGGGLYRGKPDIIVLALRLQSLAPELVAPTGTLDPAALSELEAGVLQTVVSTLKIARKNSAATLLVHNFELPPFPSSVLADATRADGSVNRVRRLNFRLAEEAGAIGQCFIVDVEHMAARIGGERALDPRLWHVGQIPYTPGMFGAIAEYYSRFAAALKGKVKKCLVLDCDNTLWGGVVGEDGPAGIALGTSYPGSAYRAFQSAILELHQRGVLLAINSKNNEKDVMEVLGNHPDCLLRPPHFAALRINWNDKAANLREIAAELNIGLDSLVFVDDSEVECGFVRESLPEVRVIQLGADPTAYEAVIRQDGSLDTLAVTAEDKVRTELMHADRQRKQSQEGAASYEDYLKTLDMVVTIECGMTENVPRISQLSQKTNQFNLTTKRYSEAQIRAFMEEANAAVYSVRLKDRFGDSGSIGAAIVLFEGRRARVDSFLLSCRVIARGVEDALLATIAEDARRRSCAVVEGSYIATDKNSIAADFYAKRGFARTNGESFELKLDGPAAPAPGWFKEINRIDRTPGKKS